MKHKKTTIAIISVIALVIVIIGITYAYWLVTETQTDRNVITTGCLDITLNGEVNDITLENQFPLSDEDGLKLTPYEFTITNNCDTAVDYQINLESLDTEGKEEISKDALKIAIYEEGTKASSVTPELLSSYAETEAMIENAISANKLLIDTLGASGSEDATQSYNLLIWIDKDAPISEMNKGFTSKISVTVGQGIENSSLKEGTLAHHIASSYTPYIIKGANNEFIANDSYFKWATSYNYDPEKGFSLSGDIIEATTEECQKGIKECGTYSLGLNTNATTSSTIMHVTNFFGDHNNPSNGFYTFMYDIVGNKTIGYNAIEGWYDLYKTKDNLGDTYYYIGDIKNNYVKLGTYNTKNKDVYCPWGTCPASLFNTKEDCVAEIENGAFWTADDCIKVENKIASYDMIWRIVRINGDGTIRLVYDTTIEDNGTTYDSYIQIPAYYYTNNDYINSEIKIVLDKFYEENLLEYKNIIADGIFCHDTTYGASDRFASHSPSLICPNDADKYSVNTKIGNGKLKYPIGLLTADEMFVAAVGTTSSTYNYSYLREGQTITMTPYNNTFYYITDKIDQGNEKVNYYLNKRNFANAIRPVINLKADVTFTGDGSYETPYEIVMN